jgi:hypothetical protein
MLKFKSFYNETREVSINPSQISAIIDRENGSCSVILIGGTRPIELAHPGHEVREKVEEALKQSK